ncbi:MAG: hypothetical protein R3C10_26855 [Pirellulales bacterium]
MSTVSTTASSDQPIESTAYFEYREEQWVSVRVPENRRESLEQIHVAVEHYLLTLLAKAQWVRDDGKSFGVNLLLFDDSNGGYPKCLVKHRTELDEFHNRIRSDCEGAGYSYCLHVEEFDVPLLKSCQRLIAQAVSLARCIDVDNRIEHILDCSNAVANEKGSVRFDPDCGIRIIVQPSSHIVDVTECLSRIEQAAALPNLDVDAHANGDGVSPAKVKALIEEQMPTTPQAKIRRQRLSFLKQHCLPEQKLSWPRIYAKYQAKHPEDRTAGAKTPCGTPGTGMGRHRKRQPRQASTVALSPSLFLAPKHRIL